MHTWDGCLTTVVYFGATARDMVLHHGFGIKARRATRDIDLAVQVPNWDEFEALKMGLIDTGSFTEARMIHGFNIKKLISNNINLSLF